MNTLRRVTPGSRWQPDAARENAWSEAAAAVLGKQFDQGKGFNPPNAGGFWALIGASPAQDGSNKRWLYAWTEAVKTSGGYGGWATLTGGRSGTTSERPAYNGLENPNGASGLYGNGVNSSNLTGTFDIQPIPAGVPVWMRVVGIDSGDPEYWFDAMNGIDGACP